MDEQEHHLHEIMAAINHAWRVNDLPAMAPHIHPNIIMKLPGFSGEIVGREALLSGFAEFCINARVLEYLESNEQIDIIGDCAVVTFRFEMLYERLKYRERSTGRDLWMFHSLNGKWIAVWRTMLELEEVRDNRS